MKWVPLAILLLAALVLQTTVVPYIALGGVTPDLVFVLVVFYAFWGPWPDVGIAGWVAGLVFDTQTADPMGLHAFCYGAVAWGIVRLRQALFREHAVTQMVITLAATVLVQFVVGLVRHRAAPTRVSWGQVLWMASMTGLYTALCAPYLHWLLNRMGRWTGLRSGARALLRP